MNDFLESTTKDELPFLRDCLDSNDASLRSKAIRRVLSLMRSGETYVSCLFSSMLRCSGTNDISLKKLIYIYLVNFSAFEHEQAIMSVNVLVKDSEDINPIVRALAVRTMCRLKIPEIAEYTITPLKKCLADKDPYVRKTAALAVAKLYEVIPESIEESMLLSQLLGLINDDNPLVISNTAMALLEINNRRTVPIFVLNEVNVTPIISAMTQCSDWVLIMLLDALAQYHPATDQEATFFIDRLIPFMKNANPAVVLGAFKCVYIFMDEYKREHGEIFKMILPPILTLVSSAESEIAYVLLTTLSLFVSRYKEALIPHVRMFFCKYNDPSYVKLEKLDIITSLISPANIVLIISELEEYINDVDVMFVRKAISCLGRISLKIPIAARFIVDILVKITTQKVSYAVQAAVIVLCDILRAYPNEFESVIATFLQCGESTFQGDPSARSAIIWIIGEYCNIIDKPDVLFDTYLDAFFDESPEVQLMILTTAFKMFLVLGDSVKDQLQFVIEKATDKSRVLPDIYTRAYIYWRLMTLNAEATKEVLGFTSKVIHDSTNQDQVHGDYINKIIKENITDPKIIDVLIQNSGTVSSIFHILPNEFVKEKILFQKSAKDDGDYDVLNLLEMSRNWEKAIIETGDLAIADIFVEIDNSTIYLKVISKQEEPLSNFALALDKNILGICLIAGNEIKFPDHIKYGEEFEVKAAISFNENYISYSDQIYQNNILKAALRTSKGTLIFEIPIDPSLFTREVSMDFNQSQFDQMWSQLPEFTKIIENSKLADHGILSGRGLFEINNEGSLSDLDKNFVFILPINKLFLAKTHYDFNTSSITVTVKGDEHLFPLLNDNLHRFFCSVD